jgi:hypothetical protein
VEDATGQAHDTADGAGVVSIIAGHTCIGDDGGTPGRKCDGCEMVKRVSAARDRRELAGDYANWIRWASIEGQWESPIWRELNQAIIARWSRSGLEFIKREAWRQSASKDGTTKRFRHRCRSMPS